LEFFFCHHTAHQHVSPHCHYIPHLHLLVHHLLYPLVSTSHPLTSEFPSHYSSNPATDNMQIAYISSVCHLDGYHSNITHSMCGIWQVGSSECPILHLNLYPSLTLPSWLCPPLSQLSLNDNHYSKCIFLTYHCLYSLHKQQCLPKSQSAQCCIIIVLMNTMTSTCLLWLLHVLHLFK
jgi:hypothetical protein